MHLHSTVKRIFIFIRKTNVRNLFNIIYTCYFLWMSLIGITGAWIFYLIQPGQNTSFIDCLLISVSCLTSTGYITTLIQDVPWANQALMLILIILGGSILNNSFILLFRLIFNQIKIRKLQNTKKNFYEGEEDENDISKRLRTEQYSFVILLIISFAYIIIIPIISAIMLIIYSGASQATREVYHSSSANFGWGSIFFAISAFHNSGFSVLNLGFFPFASNWYYLTVIGLTVLIGEALIPFNFTIIIKILNLITCKKFPSLNLLSTTGRNYHPNLFTTRHAIYSLILILFCTICQFSIFLIFDFNYEESELAELSPFYRVWNSFFMAINSRTGGFASVNYALLSAPSLMIVSIMTIIPVYSPRCRRIFVAKNINIRHLIQFKVWIFSEIYLLMFLITLTMIAENHSLRYDPNFSFYAVFFEVINAYATSGFSLGYGSSILPLCTQFNVVGKLVLILTMLLGKLRYIAEDNDYSWGLYSDGEISVKNIELHVGDIQNITKLSLRP